MRKTISISISGQLFHVEEQAYQELDGYLSSIRSHFSSYEDKDEILADIENRIAERFTEKLRKTRKVLNENDVAELITSMGTVKDFEEFESDTHTAHEAPSDKTSGTGKRLYRDPENTMIAGVAAGIANYFGIDPTIVRLLFVLTLIPGGTGILAYIVLWIVMPEAKTTSEKVEMRGQQLTIKRIEAAIRENIPEAAKKIKPGVITRIIRFPFMVIRKILSLIGRILRFLGPIAVRIIGLAILVAAILGLFAVSFAFIMLLANAWEQYMDVPVRELAGDVTYYTVLIAGYAAILLPLIFVIGVGGSMLRMRNDFRAPTVVALIGLWIAALMVGAVTIAKDIPEIQAKIDRYVELHDSAITKNIPVQSFTSVESGGGYDVVIKQGSSDSIKVSGTELAVNELQVTVEDGVLILQRATRTRFCIICLSNRATVEVTTDSIANITAHGGTEISATGIDIGGSIAAHGGARVTVSESTLPSTMVLESHGAGRIDINATEPVERLDIDASGGSRVWYTGAATNVHVVQNGASDVFLTGTGTTLSAEGHGGTRLNARDWIVEDVTIELNGAARAEVSASGSITGSLHGGSRLNFYGNPTVDVEEDPSTSVVRMDDE